MSLSAVSSTDQHMAEGSLGSLKLPILRVRLTMRLLQDTTLPAYKGAMLRGGFGYAFQRIACSQTCWGRSEACAAAMPCPYRWVFETPHPPRSTVLHNLRDVPRPFVIDLPADQRTSYPAGDTLEFGLTLMGRGIDYLPYFLMGFERLGTSGLGRSSAKARLERVEALPLWQPTGVVVYQDGRLLDNERLPVENTGAIMSRAATLGPDVRLTLLTPLRLKHRGELVRVISPPALVQAACWRLHALAAFHGGGAWDVEHRDIAAQAANILIDQEQVRWEDWERTSTRGGERRQMKLGGMIGSAVLRDVPQSVLDVLLAASVTHLGKACVFGHGSYRLETV